MSQNEQDPRTLQGVRGTKTPDTGRRPITPRLMPKSILKPSSSRGLIHPTHHGVSRKVVPNTGNKNVTPSRAPPGQPSTSNDSAPLRARKSGVPARQPVASTSANTNIKPLKTYKSLTPLGQQLDNEYEEQLLSRKKDRTGNMAGFARRRTQIRRDANIGEDILHLNVDDPQHVIAQLSPILNLRIGAQAIDAEEDEPRYRPQPRTANVNVQGFGQRVLKAARKYQTVEQSSSESESSDSESDSSDSSSSSEGTVQREERSKSKSNSDSEDVEVNNVAEDPPELVFDEEKMITAPLPDIIKVENAEGIIPDPQRHPQHGPTANLVSAVEALSPSVIRLRTTRHLPFLPRTLRKGFLERCRNLLIPIYPLDKEIHLQVQYSIAGGEVYQVELDKWMCPICDFFGEFTTREMLECHLQWDHQEVYCEWEDLGLSKIQSWRLELLIQESEPGFISPSPPSHSLVRDRTPAASTTPRTTDIQNIKRSLTPETENDSTISLRLLSPSTTHSVLRQSVITDVDIKREEIEASLELPQSSATPAQRSIPAGSTTPSTESARRSLSSLGTFDPVTPASVQRTRTTAGTRSPTSQLTPPPPPPENPLGPAAQPPYLPADYGGNMVLYSCRPGGPCLFDLLATLPMEPFGLLDWEVIDREDEIYESDDVKEEYKVMHALWARWIILNRHKFIANYAKGVIAFVDEYWKMIHWAAGWDALRYFLFIFLANNFLTGREVAQTLTHYEGLTGMASWYD